MKKLIIGCILFCLLFVGGCEPFAQGFFAGTVAMKKIGDDAQKEFIESVNALNVETAKYNALIEQIEDTEVKSALKALINEQTREQLEALNSTSWKDPKVIGGYGVGLISLIIAAYQKKQRMNEAI